MLKRTFMLLCALLLILPAMARFGFAVIASPSVSASYNANTSIVSVTGWGFVPGEDFTVVLTDAVPSIVGFLTFTADGIGRIMGSFPSDGAVFPIRVRVTSAAGGNGVSVEYLLRIGVIETVAQPPTPAPCNGVVPIAARRNPQTGEGLPVTLAISFGLAGLGVVALCFLFRSQLGHKQIYERFMARKKRLDDLLD